MINWLKRLFCKKVEEPQTKKQHSGLPTLAVIDDNGWIRGRLTQIFSPDFKVTTYMRLPQDIHILEEYDVLIVDNQGIGNDQYKDGENFLCNYNRPEHQVVVHFSGLSPHCDFREILIAKGMFWETKDCDSDKLIIQVKQQMEKQNAVTN